MTVANFMQSNRNRNWERGALALLLILNACAGRHAPSPQTVFRIETQGSALYLVPPSLPGGVAAKPIAFPQIIPDRYGFNPWEQYVDLSPGMRLAVLRMTVLKVEGAKDRMETEESSYAVAGAGRRGVRLQGPPSDGPEKPARYLRLFYQTKFMKASGQPVRPPLVLWSNTAEQLAARTAEARENPAFSCGSNPDCMAFSDRTTVSPEVQIVVNQKPRYVTLGWTVKDVLRADRISADADIRVLRKHRSQMVPVEWKQKPDVMGLPLLAGDELSW
jgi:hypothetical protein